MDRTARREDSGPDRLGRLFRLLAGGAAGDEPALRHQIHDFLLAWRSAVIGASASSSVIWAAALFLTDARWPFLFLAIDLLLCAAKWRVISDPGLTGPDRRERAVGWLMLLGLAWALLLGTGVALCIASGHDVLATLAVGVAAGTVGVASFRNAPTPRQAMGIILCVILPPAVASCVALDGKYWLIAAGLLPWSASLFVMVRQNYVVIRKASRALHDLSLTARTDPLTGLRNRLAFDERLRALTGGEAPEPFVLLFLDLDGFKAVNDHFGHEAGDRLLCRMAARIRQVGRDAETVFRIGGDEFALLLIGAQRMEIDWISVRLIRDVTEVMETGTGLRIKVGVSIGSAEWAKDGRTPEAVLRAADGALYAAKAQGRGCHLRAGG